MEPTLDFIIIILFECFTVKTLHLLKMKKWKNIALKRDYSYKENFKAYLLSHIHKSDQSLHRVSMIVGLSASETSEIVWHSYLISNPIWVWCER